MSMVRTLRLSSSSTSSSSTATNSGARDSSGSSNDSQYSSVNGDIALFPDCDSSRPSSVTEDDEFKRLHFPLFSQTGRSQFNSQIKKTSRYFSLSRFSSVFRKGPGKTRDPDTLPGSSVKRMSATAKEAIRKYLKKVKPLYEKLSQKQRTVGEMMTETDTTPSQRDSAVSSSLLTKPERSVRETELSGKTSRRKQTGVMLSHSFSGNLRYPRRRSYVSSCPSSMRSSPSHSGALSRSGFTVADKAAAAANGGMYSGDTSSTMEELQSAIQGAIAHCKNSLIQNKSMVSNEI